MLSSKAGARVPVTTLLHDVKDTQGRDANGYSLPQNSWSASGDTPKQEKEPDTATCTRQNSGIVSLTPGPKHAHAPPPNSRLLRANLWADSPSKGTPHPGAAARAGPEGSMDVSVPPRCVPSALWSGVSPGRELSCATPTAWLRHEDSPAQVSYEESIQFNTSVTYDFTAKGASIGEETPSKRAPGPLDVVLDDLLRDCRLLESPAAVPVAKEQLDESMQWPHSGQEGRTNRDSDADRSCESHMPTALRTLGKPVNEPSCGAGLTFSSSEPLPHDEKVLRRAPFTTDATLGCGWDTARQLNVNVIVESDGESEAVDDGATGVTSTGAAAAAAAADPAVCFARLPPRVSHDDSIFTEGSDFSSLLREQEVTRLHNVEDPISHSTCPTNSDGWSLTRRPLSDRTNLLSTTPATAGAMRKKRQFGDVSCGPATAATHHVSAPRCGRPRAPIVTGASSSAVAVGGRRVPVDKLYLVRLGPEEREAQGPSKRRVPTTMPESAPAVSGPPPYVNAPPPYAKAVASSRECAPGPSRRAAAR